MIQLGFAIHLKSSEEERNSVKHHKIMTFPCACLCQGNESCGDFFARNFTENEARNSWDKAMVTEPGTGIETDRRGVGLTQGTPVLIGERVKRQMRN